MFWRRAGPLKKGQKDWPELTKYWQAIKLFFAKIKLTRFRSIQIRFLDRKTGIAIRCDEMRWPQQQQQLFRVLNDSTINRREWELSLRFIVSRFRSKFFFALQVKVGKLLLRDLIWENNSTRFFVLSSFSAFLPKRLNWNFASVTKSEDSNLICN